MRHSAVLGLLPLIFLTTLPAQAQMVTITPEQIGQIFCIGSLGNDMAPVEALLTADLTAVIVEAEQKDAAFAAAHPDDKPPLGDGLPWRSWPDYADGCTVGEALTQGKMTIVPINYSFSDYPDANYTNALVLIPADLADGAPAVWRIDNINLGEGQTFRSVLEAAFAR